MDTCKAGPSKVLSYKHCVSKMEGESYRYSRGRPERYYTQCMHDFLFVNIRRETKVTILPPLLPQILPVSLSRSWKLSCMISGGGKSSRVNPLCDGRPQSSHTQQASLLYDHSIPSPLKDMHGYRSGGVMLKTYVEGNGLRMG